MNLIIDGHNLIPYVPGINLGDVDDEMALIKRLVAYCQVQKASIDVFFDQAAQGRHGTRSFGAVRAHFVHKDKTADQAIIALLHRLGKNAWNYQVVTSDRMVIAAVHSMHAGHMSSAGFAAQMIKAAETAAEQGEVEPEITSDEVDEWEKIFKHSKKSEKYNK